MYRYKKSCVVILILFSSFSLYSLDVVTFRNGIIVKGEITNYTSLGEIAIKTIEGITLITPSEDVISIEKPDKLSISIVNCSEELIYYHEGVKKLFTHISPRYTYRGVSYTIDPEWGIDSDLEEFYSYLKEEHPTLDNKTLSLITDLEIKMKDQNISMGIAGLLIASGTAMTFLPLNFDDIASTPTYGKVISISGLSLNIVGLGMMIYNAFINQGEYPRLIADSFNEWIEHKK